MGVLLVRAVVLLGRQEVEWENFTSRREQGRIRLRGDGEKGKGSRRGKMVFGFRKLL